MSEVDGSCETVEIPYYGVPDLSRFLQHEINPQSSRSRGTAGLSADTSIANTVSVPEQNHVQQDTEVWGSVSTAVTENATGPKKMYVKCSE